MQLTIEKPDLLAALQKVAAVVPRRATVPIIGHLKLEAEGERLTITGTNADMWCSASAQCVGIDEPGAICVSAERFDAFVRTARDGAQIGLRLDNSDQARLRIKSGPQNLRLATMPADDFPIPKVDDLQHEITLPTGALLGALAHTAPVAAVEDTRYYITGVFVETLEAPERLLRFSATDSRRAAQIWLPLPDGASLPLHDVNHTEGEDDRHGAIVPRPVCDHLRKLLADVEGEAELAFSAGIVRADIGNVRLIARLIDGTYTFLHRAIPAPVDQPVEVDPAELLAALKRLTPFTEDDKDGKLTIRCEVDPDGVKLTTKLGVEADGGDEISVSYDGEPVLFGLDPRQGQDAFGWCGDRVEIHFQDIKLPMLIRDPSRPDRLHVLGPRLVA